MARQVHGTVLQNRLHGKDALDLEEIEPRNELLVECVIAGHPTRDDIDEIIPIAPDAIGQFALGERAVLLERGQDSEVKIVNYFRLSDHMIRFRARCAENM